MNITKERIKNVLICVLLMGMIYFVYSVWFFDSPFDTSTLADFLGTSQMVGGEARGEGSDIEALGVRPLALLLRTDAFCGGATYESAVSDEIYKAMRPSLKKAFAATQSIEAASRDEWDNAIMQQGVFLDYRGDVPYGAVKLWLTGNVEKSEACGRYFMLSCENRNVVLYMKDSGGLIYKAATRYSAEELITVIGEIPASSARLAAEAEEEDYAAVFPETIMVENRATPSVISAYNTYVSYYGNVKNACLESFRLTDVSPSTYSESDGTEVYVADMVTMKLLPEGIALYSDMRNEIDDTLGIGVEFKGEAPTLAEKTEAARALCAGIASRLPGKGGIYVIATYKNGDESEIVLGRHIGGIPVDMKGSAYFARVNIKGSSVRAVRINLRGYDVLSQSADVLSERLAAAAVNGSGKYGDMNLRYADSGNDTVSPSWFIGGIRKLTEEAEKDELVES